MTPTTANEDFRCPYCDAENPNIIRETQLPHQTVISHFGFQAHTLKYEVSSTDIENQQETTTYFCGSCEELLDASIIPAEIKL